jgi:hypothetical protein
MNRLEVYRAECDEVSRFLKTGLDSDSYTLVASAAEMAVLKARDIVANEADNVSEYSPTTWREVLSVLQKLLDIQLVAAKKLPTLTKSSREVAEGDQMAAVLSAFRISSEGR